MMTAIRNTLLYLLLLVIVVPVCAFQILPGTKPIRSSVSYSLLLFDRHKPLLPPSISSSSSSRLLRQSTRLTVTSTTGEDKPRSTRRSKTKSNSKSKNQRRNKRRSTKTSTITTTNSATSTPRDPTALETWRFFNIEVHPDSYCTEAENYGEQVSSTENLPVDKLFLTLPTKRALLEKLQLTTDTTGLIKDIRVVRRSVDARKSKSKLQKGPRYVFVLDVDLMGKDALKLRLTEQPGQLELLSTVNGDKEDKEEMKKTDNTQPDNDKNQNNKQKPRVIIVGAGPAGLFCALTLAESGLVTPIVLERGLPVESRGRSIGALIHRSQMDKESNFAFGEGGAGTWSDGKLTTRIGRNSGAVRHVLETFVKYGAPPKILVHGSPHLGTDNLVKLLRAMRLDLRKLGGEVHFGAKMTQLIVDHDNLNDDGIGITRGVQFTQQQQAMERNVPAIQNNNSNGHNDATTIQTLLGDAVVLGTGHSARDIYEQLHKDGIQLEAKGFAVGFRVEHPQKVINKIQYGTEWGLTVVTGKKTTDLENDHYFQALTKTKTDVSAQHKGRLPVPSYRLATNHAKDGSGHERGVYSFCMCPGGQIVPASTDPNEVCVNGMSFSRRDSTFANSALVVTVDPDDDILEPYREQYGVLAGVAFQRDMEQRASVLGGGNLTVPVQRVTDFLAGQASTSAPLSSYRLGVKPAACHEIYPTPLVNSLRDALTQQFEKQMPGFVCEDALLHGVETRTSSPVRVSRDVETMEAKGTKNLYPAGEGAGFAGGIVSAAVDGMAVANAILERLSNTESVSCVDNQQQDGTDLQL